MNATRLLSRASLTGGILVVLVGVLHTTATPMVYRQAIPVLSDKALGMAYFFGVMGVYVTFCGGLMIYAAGGLGRGERWARALTVANGAVNAVLGVGAVAVGFRNPLVWAWLVVAAALAVLAASSRAANVAVEGRRAA